jgi:hypothetical protein
MPKRPYRQVADSWFSRASSHALEVGRRFKRDILPLLLTRQAAECLPASPPLPTVFIAEQW